MMSWHTFLVPPASDRQQKEPQRGVQELKLHLQVTGNKRNLKKGVQELRNAMCQQKLSKGYHRFITLLLLHDGSHPCINPLLDCQVALTYLNFYKHQVEFYGFPSQWWVDTHVLFHLQVTGNKRNPKRGVQELKPHLQVTGNKRNLKKVSRSLEMQCPSSTCKWQATKGTPKGCPGTELHTVFQAVINVWVSFMASQANDKHKQNNKHNCNVW